MVGLGFLRLVAPFRILECEKAIFDCVVDSDDHVLDFAGGHCFHYPGGDLV
jgi:hypothetical protein